ncbi:helix-turn-helix domain-containing protein [Kitasatospora sp. NPDC048239]|uniref:helix-turn-helix domain-containing protein n=1 Tax=Kitasatospora sp. NPDC048239 TaxID=3364046 RepID=UPI0037128384
MSSTTFQRNFARITAGQTVATITKRTGLDQGSISRYLRGTREPRVGRLQRIARAYDISVSELLDDVEEAA